MAEGGALLRRCALTGTEGSNPSLSAITNECRRDGFRHAAFFCVATHILSINLDVTERTRCTLRNAVTAHPRSKPSLLPANITAVIKSNQVFNSTNEFLERECPCALLSHLK